MGYLAPRVLRTLTVARRLPYRETATLLKRPYLNHLNLTRALVHLR